MEKIEAICFRMVSEVGKSRSCYMEACQKARKGLFDEAQEKIKEANEHYRRGHEVHFELLQDDASGNGSNICLLLLHAEDLMTGTENFKVMAEEVIRLYAVMVHNKLDISLQ